MSLLFVLYEKLFSVICNSILPQMPFLAQFFKTFIWKFILDLEPIYGKLITVSNNPPTVPVKLLLNYQRNMTKSPESQFCEGFRKQTH